MRPNGEAGCGSFVIEVTPYEDETNIIATAFYNFKINVDPNCNLTSTEDLEISNIKIFPNPVENEFSISDNNYVGKVEVYNLVGKLIMAKNYNNGDTFNLSQYPDGIYLIKMQNEDGEMIKSEKLVKR